MSDKLTASSGVDPSAKTISVPVFHLYHKLLPGTTLKGVQVEAATLPLLTLVFVCFFNFLLQVSPSRPR